MVAGNPLTSKDAGMGGVASLATVPVIEASAIPVAVMVCVPTVSRVMLKVAIPFRRETSPGRVASASELVMRTVSPQVGTRLPKASLANTVTGRETPIAPPAPESVRPETAAGVTLTFEPPLAGPPGSVTPTYFEPAVFRVTVKVWDPASATVNM